MTPIETFLSRLDKVRSVGDNQWNALCPAHEDRSPSLGISEGTDSRVLLICRAGCDFRSIVAALGLEPKDMFPPSRMSPRERRQYSKVLTLREVEQALYYELLVLIQFVGNRVASRQLARDRNFRMLRPEWQPMPPGHWDRELLAAKRIKRGLRVVYGQ